jgi:hypothetical protein
MRDISDEVLMAYADDALDTKTRAEVAGRIARDPAVAVRLEAFVVTNKPLARVFAPILDEPIPARILAALDGPRTSATVHVLRPKREAGAPRDRSDLWRIAAALVVGLGGGWGFQTLLAPSATSGAALVVLDKGQMIAQGSLAQVLESGASSQVRSGDAGSIAVVFTFKTRDGGYCRQYQVNSNEGRAVAGVACRDANGGWPVVVQADAAPMAISAGKIVPAGAENPGIDAVVNRLIEADVMSLEQETDLVRRGWRVQP